MKKLLTSLFVTSAVAVGSVIAPLTAHAGYAPAGRPTFQCESATYCTGADHVVFNSITNAVNYGDERAFFDGKQAGSTTEGGYLDNIPVHNGEKLVLRVYIHNNANPKTIGVEAATAKNTYMKVKLPTGKAATQQAAAQISASNADPMNISDTVDLHGDKPFTLAFDKNEAVRITHRVNGQGDFVSEDVSGVQYTGDQEFRADFGDWHGCFEYSALVTFVVTVKMDTPPEQPPEQPPSTPPSTPPASPSSPSVPSAPTSLPSTGPVEAVSGIFGTGALGYGIRQWLLSRQRISNLLKL